MDAASLRPLGIGETLDVAIKLYRDRFVTLAKAVAVVTAPVYVFTSLVQLSFASPDGEFTAGDFWTFLAGALIAGFAGFVANQLATAACLKNVSAAYLGEDPDWRDSLRFALSRLRSLIWLAIVFGVLFALAFIACVIPSIYFYTAWAVAVPVLLLEDVRGGKALKRSRQLVRGRWWQVFAVVILAFILSLIVQSALTGILIGVTGAAGNQLLDAIAGLIGETASAVITTPFTAAVVMVVYFDLRVRKEGFDLELLARRVGVEPSDHPIAPPPPPFAANRDQPPFWPPPPGWRPPDE
jgi:hypothetical protein